MRATVKPVHLLLACLAALVFCTALATTSASAKTVYDYVYSGGYIDGSGSQAGAFTTTPAGLGYDETTERLLVSRGSSLMKFTKAGTPDPFSASGLTDTITLPDPQSFESFIAVDNTGGATDGRIYVLSLGFGSPISAYERDGTPVPGFHQGLAGACGVAVDPQGYAWWFKGDYDEIIRFEPNGEWSENNLDKLRAEGKLILPMQDGKPYKACAGAFDATGNLYVVRAGNGTTGKPIKLNAKGDYLYDLSQSTNARSFAVDSSNNDVFVSEGFSGNVISQFDDEGAKLGSFGAPDPGHSFEGLEGSGRTMVVDPATHDLWVVNARSYAGVRHLEKFVRSAPITVPTATTAAPSLSPTAVTLRGTINADGIATTDCHFAWGATQALENSIPCAEGSSFSGAADNAVSAQVENLNKGGTYYFKLVASNGNGRISNGATRTFFPQGPPLLSNVGVSHVNIDGVRFDAEIDPNGGHTTYHVEYGTSEVYDHSTAESSSFGTLTVKSATDVVSGLAPHTTYHYRVVVKNEAGTTTGEDHTFTTYPPDPSRDSCPNAVARQQATASLLLDCRSYELVSAANAGGYDVESDLIPGQQPLVSPAGAHDRLLYSIHAGAIPGISGNPTNFDRDPYLATRGPDGWSTSYVGLPADGMAQKGAFGSPLLEADSALDSFAFGGSGICSPCFREGTDETTNIPLRGADRSLSKGMAGTLAPLGAEPSGYVAKRFSGDGDHFVFGSTAKFEPAGKNGFMTIYERDLTAGTTQVVSTLPNGQTIGAGAGEELDISADGSRVLIGTTVATDAAGNSLRHLYMHLDANPKSVDLTPGTTSGVLYDGMSADGSRVFFTTADHLLPADTDQSADIYQAHIDEAGKSALSLVSVTQSGPSNDDSCQPPGIPDSWNSAEGDGHCGALAFAGGAGAGADGSFYFLSPELLDGPGDGVANQANLYLLRPGGKPDFVEVFDSSVGKPGPEETYGLVGTIGGLSKPEPSISKPLDVAVDNSGGPSQGDIYVSDGAKFIVKKFDPARNPVTSWGVNGILDGSSAPFEIEVPSPKGSWRIILDGQSTGATGTGNLSATTTGTGDLSAGTGSGDTSILAVGRGDLTTLATGNGDLSAGSTTINNLSTTTGTFSVGESISSSGGSGLTAGTTITAVGSNTLTISSPATETRSSALRSGSKEVTNVTLSSASGTGDLQSGSPQINNFATTSGTFEPGETISGAGIPAATQIVSVGTVSHILTLSRPVTATSSGTALSAVSGSFAAGGSISGSNIQPGTTIAAVGPGTLTLSRGVTAAGVAQNLRSGSTEVTNVTTSTGSFAVGQEISGTGIPADTTITGLGAGALTLSNGVTDPAAAGTSLKAGARQITNVTTTTGAFAVGQPINGAGIAPGTTITSTGANTLTLSKALTAPGVSQPLFAGQGTVSNVNALTGTFLLGERVTAADIPTETTITGVGPGTLTLSLPPKQATIGESLAADLPASASSGLLQQALVALSNVNPGDVSVSGGPGGSQPFLLQFEGQYGGSGNAPQLKINNLDMGGWGFPHEEWEVGPPQFSPRRYFEGLLTAPDGSLIIPTDADPDYGKFFHSDGNDHVYEFAQDGTFSSYAWTADGLGSPAFSPVVDSHGYYYTLHNYPGYGTEGYVARRPKATFLLDNLSYSGTSFLTAIALDSSSGDLYASTENGALLRTSFDAEGEILAPGGGPCVPIQTPLGGNSNLFCPPTETLSTGLKGITALAVNPVDHHIFADLGDRIVELDSTGKPVGQAFGIGVLSESNSLAYSTANGHLYASTAVGSAGAVRDFAIVPTSWRPLDNPAIVHAIEDVDTNRTADFQVTDNGDFAAFASSRSLTGADNRGHYHVYRYDATASSLDCGSCPPTNASSSADVFLAPYGRNLTEDGRLFFTSTEGLVLRDTNEAKDAYEWNQGAVQLVSTGASGEPSGLLTVGADGTDAFFFTRQTLVPEDENGSTVKIYDARAGGGSVYDPPSPLCAAADECHGAGTQPPPAPPINTIEGSGKGTRPTARKPRCRKGRVRRNGRCVKPHRKHKSSKRQSRRKHD